MKKKNKKKPSPSTEDVFLKCGHISPLFVLLSRCGIHGDREGGAGLRLGALSEDPSRTLPIV